MRNKLIIRITIILLLAISGCKDNVDLPNQPLTNYTQIYMPQAINGPVIYSFSITDSTPQSIIYGADYGGFNYPTENVSVKFTIRKDLIDSFNINYGTNYSLLSSSKYSLSDTSAIIHKGQLSTEPLKIILNTKSWSSGESFLLPISIVESSIKVNASLSTTYFIINAAD